MTEREQFEVWWKKCPVGAMAEVPAATVWNACNAAQLAAPDLRATFRDTMDSLDMAELAVQQEQRIAELEKQPAAPAGYQLVPIEPTYDMIHAAAAVRELNHEPLLAQFYRAMLDAAPQGADHE